MLARLHECKYLLLSLVVITVLPAIPELFIRSKSWSLFISNQRPTFHQVHCGLLWSGRLHSLHKVWLSREKKRFSSSKYFPQGRHVRLVHPLQTAPTPPPPRCPCPPLPLQTKVPLSKIIPKKTFFRTFAAKRISLIFLGEPAVCECGPSGAELTRPHECPKMARWSNFCNFWGEEILFFWFPGRDQTS